MRKRGCFYSLNTCIIHRKCSSMNMNMIIKNKREDAIILAFWTGFGNHEVVGPCCYLWHVSEISQVGPQSTMILSSIYRLTHPLSDQRVADCWNCLHEDGEVKIKSLMSRRPSIWINSWCFWIDNDFVMPSAGMWFVDFQRIRTFSPCTSCLNQW